MKGRIIPKGILELEAENSEEAETLGILFDHGVRIVSGSEWKLVIADPALAKLKSFLFNPNEIKMIHDALVNSASESAMTDKVKMRLIRDMYPDIG